MIIWYWMCILEGFTIEPFSESIGKLSYEEEIDNHLTRDIIG